MERCECCGIKVEKDYGLFNDAGKKEPFCGRKCCRDQVHYCPTCQQYSNGEQCNNPECSE